MKSGLVAPTDIPHFAEKIYAETHRLVHLVEDPLRLSRLDEGAEDMRWSQVDLWAVAERAVQEQAGPAELAGVQVKLVGTKAKIQGIPQLVSGIVCNLLDNAIKYNHAGGKVTIRIAKEGTETLLEVADTGIGIPAEHQDGGKVTIRIAKEGTETLLEVADTGIGIPAEHQDRVFERFYRVDKSHSKEVGGTGLGLSIVKHAALILGAKLTLDSQVGKGTTIRVRFPEEMAENCGQESTPPSDGCLG